jgi:hypothetical protein
MVIINFNCRLDSATLIVVGEQLFNFCIFILLSYKVVEAIILERIPACLSTNANRFGFKPKLSTEMPIYLLKEVFDRYRSLNGNVFACFLDASKAFDRVNHSLSPLTCNQTMCVRWAGVTSSAFKTTNGVRQGGILSPYLFNIYVDDLSQRLNMCNTGCVIGSENVNHVMYADDLVIFSPCEEGLLDLLHICEEFGISHDLL